jgi:CPA1 family monovalent cation:H+ antiporter
LGTETVRFACVPIGLTGLPFNEAVLGMAILLALAALLSLFTDRIRLPYELALVAVGWAAAEVAHALGANVEPSGEGFRDTVEYVFLPTLIFAAARSTPVRRFLRSLGPILLIAFVGYLISVAVIGVGVWLVIGIGLLPAFVFGALISATDTATVTAIFRKLGVPDRVRTLVEGESLVNDGVAITVFGLLVAALGTNEFHPAEGVLELVEVVLGGTAIGLLVGVVWVAIVPRMSAFGVAGVSLAAAYGAFALADVLEFSGPIATLACGLVVGMTKSIAAPYTARRLEDAQWESFDFIANTFLFLLIGVALQVTEVVDLAAVLFAYVLAMVARAAGVVPVLALAQRLFHMPAVSKSLHAVMVWGGLRGGVALALALTLPTVALDDRSLLIAMTAGVVVLGLVINGTTLGPLVRRLGLAERTVEDRYLTAIGRAIGLQRASAWLKEFGRGDTSNALARLDAVMRDVERELESLDLSRERQHTILAWRALEVERGALHQLHDASLIAPPRAWRLIHETGDRIEAIAGDLTGMRMAMRAPIGRALESVLMLSAVIGLRTRRRREPELSDARVHLFAYHEVERVFTGLLKVRGIDREALLELRDEYLERAERQREEIRRQDRTTPEFAADRALSLIGAGRMISRSTERALVEARLLPIELARAGSAENDEALGIAPDLTATREPEFDEELEEAP